MSDITYYPRRFRYEVEVKNLFSGEWYFFNSYRFRWRAHSTARSRANLGFRQYRVIDTKGDDS